MEKILKKIGAWSILLPIIGGLIGIVSSFAVTKNKIEVLEETHKEDIDKIEKKIDEMHWFLIKRNKVKIPKGVK